MNEIDEFILCWAGMGFWVSTFIYFPTWLFSGLYKSPNTYNNLYQDIFNINLVKRVLLKEGPPLTGNIMIILNDCHKWTMEAYNILYGLNILNELYPEKTKDTIWDAYKLLKWLRKCIK